MDFQPMTPEERDRMMQFLLNQQALFAADHAKSLERLDRVEGALLTVVGAIGQIADRLDQLAAAQEKTDEQLKQTDEQSKRTGDRLDIVVNMFERHLREDHGIQ